LASSPDKSSGAALLEMSAARGGTLTGNLKQNITASWMISGLVWK